MLHALNQQFYQKRDEAKQVCAQKILEAEQQIQEEIENEGSYDESESVSQGSSETDCDDIVEEFVYHEDPLVSMLSKLLFTCFNQLYYLETQNVRQMW